MVVPTIGFFSPLPLAMMIPFMATQSLAMGEAFGKSFQYGKRKISAMTNEEFNKYTMSDMMDEQTSNYRMIIPKLHEQMAASQAMQQDIFSEMIKIIPTFFKAIMETLNIAPPQTLGEYEATITQASTESPPTTLQLMSHGDTITTDKILEEKPDYRNKPTTQDIAQYTFAMQQGTDATILANHSVLHTLANWQKSIIVTEYNKRRLNPKNQALGQTITGTLAPSIGTDAAAFTAFTQDIAQATTYFLSTLTRYRQGTPGGYNQVLHWKKKLITLSRNTRGSQSIRLAAQALQRDLNTGKYSITK